MPAEVDACVNYKDCAINSFKEKKLNNLFWLLDPGARVRFRFLVVLRENHIFLNRQSL